MNEMQFSSALRTAREVRKISRPRLAIEIAGKKISAKGVEGQLSRFEGGHRVPSEKRVVEIADTLSRLANDSVTEKDRLLSQLMKAANKEVSDADQLEFLENKCNSALLDAGLKKHEVQTILDHVSVATKQRIAESAMKGEKIEFIDLRDLSVELQKTATKYAGTGSSSKRGESADHTIRAGRAKILVSGELTPIQDKLLRDVAKMIKNILAT